MQGAAFIAALKLCSTQNLKSARYLPAILISANPRSAHAGAQNSKLSAAKSSATCLGELETVSRHLHNIPPYGQGGGCRRRGDVPHVQHFLRLHELKIVHQRSVRAHGLRANSGTIRDQVSGRQFPAPVAAEPLRTRSCSANDKIRWPRRASIFPPCARSRDTSECRPDRAG